MGRDGSDYIPCIAAVQLCTPWNGLAYTSDLTAASNACRERISPFPSRSPNLTSYSESTTKDTTATSSHPVQDDCLESEGYTARGKGYTCDTECGKPGVRVIAPSSPDVMIPCSDLRMSRLCIFPAGSRRRPWINHAGFWT